MRKIKVEKLTRDAFNAFGMYYDFAEPFGIVKPSRLRRQILPVAKFPCLRAFSTLCQSVDFVNILKLRFPRMGAGALSFANRGSRQRLSASVSKISRPTTEPPSTRPMDFSP